MLFELVWILYVVGILFFVTLGVYGIISSFLIESRNIKSLMIALSIGFFLLGIYFSTRWSIEKKEVEKITLQLEEILKKSMNQTRR
jgi:predicted transporter